MGWCGQGAHLPVPAACRPAATWTRGDFLQDGGPSSADPVSGMPAAEENSARVLPGPGTAGAQ